MEAGEPAGVGRNFVVDSRFRGNDKEKERMI